MRTREGLLWGLTGMLLASIALNGYLWSRRAHPAIPSQAQSTPSPEALGLTDEQRHQITSCCGT